MKQAQKLLEELDSLFAADHYAADKVLQKIKSRYGNHQDEWIKAQIQLRNITLGEAFKRNKEEELFDSKLLAFFEKNSLRYEAAALIMSRINFLLNKGDVSRAEVLLAEMRDKKLTEASMVISFVYLNHCANIHLRKNQHAQLLSVSLDALAKLEAIDLRDSEWHRFYLIFTGNVITVYANFEEYEKALEYIVSAKEIAEKESINLNQRSFFWRDVAEYYTAINDHVNAVLYFNRSIALLKDKEAYSFLLLGAYYRLSRQYFLWHRETPIGDQNKREELLNRLEENVMAIEKHKDREKFPILQIVRPMNLARLELLKGNYSKAIKNLKKAQQLTDQLQFNVHLFTLENYRLNHIAHYEWWLQTKNAETLVEAYAFSQKVQTIVESDAKAKVQNRLDAVRGFYELEQEKLNKKLLQQQINTINKELQLTNLNLHEKVMVLEELKTFVHSLKKKNLNTRELINAIEKKIDVVKITEQDKATLQQKMDDGNKHLSKILSDKYPVLSSLEIQMCALFQTGMTNKELAKLYGQTELAYKQHRYRIKRKMNLNAETDLVKHLKTLSNRLTD